MSVEEIIKAVSDCCAPELETLIGALPLALPIEALVALGVAVAKEITARTEKEQLQDAASAIDAEVDALEKLALK